MTGSYPTGRLLSAGCGLLMVATVGAQTSGIAVLVAALAAISVLAAIQFRVAATLAVLLDVAALAIVNPSPTLAATSGVLAAAYLGLRHTTGSAASAATLPTISCVVMFTAVALWATTLPVRLPWAPLAAPIIVLIMYLLATHPFPRRNR